MSPEEEKQIDAVALITDPEGIVKALRAEYEEQLNSLRGDLLTTQGTLLNVQQDMGRLIHEMDEMRRPVQPVRPYYTTPVNQY